MINDERFKKSKWLRQAQPNNDNRILVLEMSS